MTIKEALEAKGVWVKGNQCSCPFHDNNSLNAMINENNIYCFVCGKAFLIPQIEQKLNLKIKMEENKKKENNDNWGVPIFFY